ncbi:hypothetical protein SDC9_98476 [bioreactor metagenome]|uniref:Coenzyme Q-binding protein COQ10 START domain-containing protein n=1 Tax=bioreactor metagenome TaxID=1076179 RepID=A0A645AEU4_9ZZZZ|nr:SRPBCC family protein [Candidatus Metalachnospira sp.]
MKKSTIKAVFNSDIKRVWDTVTDNKNFAWRSDLSKIEVSDEGSKFYEYTNDGYKTEFVITLKKSFERYEFDMNNKNMNGHWTGVFIKNGNGTKIVFTEEVTVKNPIMNLFVGSFLKKQQSTYIADLKKALGE